MSILQVPPFMGCPGLMNEFPAIGYLCYAQNTLVSPGGKHCNSLEGMSKKGFFLERLALFRRCFIANVFGQRWYVENVSFWLNNRKICDKIDNFCFLAYMSDFLWYWHRVWNITNCVQATFGLFWSSIIQIVLERSAVATTVRLCVAIVL